MLLEVLGVGSFSRKHIVYDKAAGRGAAGLNGVVDSRPLPQAVGFGPFCARAPAELRSAPRILRSGEVKRLFVPLTSAR